MHSNHQKESKIRPLPGMDLSIQASRFAKRVMDSHWGVFKLKYNEH